MRNSPTSLLRSLHNRIRAIDPVPAVIVSPFVLLLVGFLLCSVPGCAEFDAWLTQHQEQIEQVQAATAAGGAALAPATGGISLLVSTILGAAFPTVVAINRAIVAWKRDKAKKEAEAKAQATEAAAAKVVTSIDAAKSAAALAGQPGVDFSNPEVKKLLNSLQGTDGKALVDAIQAASRG